MNGWRRYSVLLVAFGLIAPCGAARGSDAAAMSAETARNRLAAIMATPEADEESLTALIEIRERCVDPGVASVAAFNAGTMAMAVGDPRAADLLRDAERGAVDAAVRARARFNLAHAVMPSVDDEPQDMAAIDARIGALREAAGLFRSVLEVEPRHQDAAANTERVRKMIRDLLERRAQLEEQERARQELADQLEQLAQQQQQRADQSGERAQRGERPDAEDAAGQQDVSEQTERAGSQAERAGAGEEAREEIERARDAQRRASEAIERGDATEAAARQQEASEALRRAAERLRQAGKGEEQAGQDGQETGAEQDEAQGEGDPQDGQSGRAEGEAGPPIDPLAEALLEKERREREQRGQYLQRGTRQRVERDW